MKKSIIMVIIMSAVAVLCAVSVSVYAMNRGKGNENNKNRLDPKDNTVFNDRPVAEMTEEEKNAEYENIVNDYSTPVIYGNMLNGARRIKRLKILEGLLPETQPSLTFQKALDILNEIASDPEKAYTAKNRFDEVAGSPDIEWGSGSSYYLYIIDQEKGEYLNVSDFGCTVDYWSPEGRKIMYVEGLGVVINEPEESVKERMMQMVNDIYK